MVLSSWQSHCKSLSGSFDECRLNVEVAANPQTKCARQKWQLPSTSTIAILLLVSRKSDTHFTVARRVEGYVNLGTSVRVYSPCPRLYIAVAVMMNTTTRGEILTWVLSDSLSYETEVQAKLLPRSRNISLLVPPVLR